MEGSYPYVQISVNRGVFWPQLRHCGVLFLLITVVSFSFHRHNLSIPLGQHVREIDRGLYGFSPFLLQLSGMSLCTFFSQKLDPFCNFSPSLHLQHLKENCSWMLERLWNLITRNRAGVWLHTSWVFLFFLPPRGPREGWWLCRWWCGRIWQLSSFHSPSPPSQVQEKESTEQWGPMALLALIQADTQGHASHACQALRLQLSCLSLPWPSATREVLLRSSCSGLMLTRNLLFPGFFIFCFSFPGKAIPSAQESFTVPFCFSLRSCFYSSRSFLLM